MNNSFRLCQGFSSMLLLIAIVPAFGAKSEDNTTHRVEVTVDFGPDRGQNRGTLFEIADAEGNVVAGAGFLGAYNTYIRGERDTLHFFMRPKDVSPEWSIERLPSVETTATGLYPFAIGGQLYVYNPAIPGSPVRLWNSSERTWEVAQGIYPRTHLVAGKPLVQWGDQLLYDGHVIVDAAQSDERIGEHYYAQGNLFVRQLRGDGDTRRNRIVVYPWIPEKEATGLLSPNEKWTHELSNPQEFFYTFGQWRNHVLGVTNVGTVLRFADDEWNVLRESVPNVSYQIYCSIDVHDKLLLGQYPDGCMYEYAGDNVTPLAGWPPAMPGVAKTARELQTAAIYGGDLFAGVWPWAEVWKYNSGRAHWDFVQRMFDHPEVTDKVQHPYEAETRRVEKEQNLWGQRVTGLLPLENSLIITTSSKRGFEWDSRFDFLSPEQRADYPAVHRATVPGSLAVTTQWKPGPTTFAFNFADGQLTIQQDCQQLGKMAVDTKLQERFAPASIRWRNGVFGPSSAKFVKQSSTVAAVSLPPTMRAAYLHPDHAYKNPDDPDARKATSKQILDQVDALGLNALFPYFTGSSGQPYYTSDIAAGNPFGPHDPLTDFVSEAKSRGIKVYPVVCVAVCGNEDPAGILLEHPEWGLRHPDGRPLGYLSPAHPEARKWVIGLIEEILKRYQPDGILLDYIRFHNRPLRLDVAAEAQFERSLPENCSPEERKTRLQEFKEQAVTTWVREIAEAVRRTQPGAALGAYCWGPHTLKNHLTAQVWPNWVAAGDLDFVNISGYYHRETYKDRFMTLFEKKMAETVAINQALPRPAGLSFALGVVTSHGSVHSTEDILTYRQRAETIGMPGFAYYLLNDLGPYMDELIKATDATTDAKNTSSTPSENESKADP